MRDHAFISSLTVTVSALIMSLLKDSFDLIYLRHKPPKVYLDLPDFI
jgi:hypothetical protein